MSAGTSANSGCELRRHEFEPRAARLAQFDDHVVAIGRRVLHLADDVGQPARACAAGS